MQGESKAVRLGRWPKGTSGNPAGKRKGTRHRATLLMEKLLAADAEAVVAVVIDAARMGDMTAARIVIDRLLPPAKDRPVVIELPDTSTATGCEAAQAAIVAAVAAGSVTPSEGAAISELIEARRRAIETSELVRRMEAIEAEILGGAGDEG